jgi:hypothetical protein
MSRTSRLAAAELGLFHLLEARAAIAGNPLADVPLAYGWPGDELAAEHVWIGEEATSTQEWQITGTGTQAKTETASLEVWFWVVTPGNTYPVARDRILAMVGELEIALRDDWQLEGQVFDATLTRIRKAAAPADNARGLFVRADVEFIAWLS